MALLAASEVLYDSDIIWKSEVFGQYVRDTLFEGQLCYLNKYKFNGNNLYPRKESRCLILD